MKRHASGGLGAILMLTLVTTAIAQTPLPAGPSRPSRGGPVRLPTVHDPSTIVKHEDSYWVFCTGHGVASFHSRDLITWNSGPRVFDQPPVWVAEVVPGNRGHFWAPDIIHHRGRYLLYYSVSTFGKNTSAIALASTPTLDPQSSDYAWTDHGVVVRSRPEDDYNAIDPSVVHGPDDTLWMAFGSFWSGIKLIQLDSTSGLRSPADQTIHSLARAPQIEAAALYRHGDYFYQFVNWGWCCRGIESTYNIRIGRSRDIAGPYLDREGRDLRHGGGSLLLGTEGRFIGPGHAGIFREGDRHWMSYHFYDGQRRGQARLAIRALEWDDQGWPRVSGPPITPTD
jgi:arabinan endo-1,5-alpha-L-arabinosidase